MVNSPSSLVKSAWISRLADSTIGFNTTYATQASSYPGAPPTSIDFGTTSKNFFLGNFEPEQAESTSVFTYPYMCMYSTAAVNQNLQKFKRFAGLVRTTVKVTLSGPAYTSSRLLHDYEAWPDAIEDTMYKVINQQVAQNWGNSIVYNGQMSHDRSELQDLGSNWRQVTRFIATFEVVIP